MIKELNINARAIVLLRAWKCVASLQHILLHNNKYDYDCFALRGDDHQEILNGLDSFKAIDALRDDLIELIKEETGLCFLKNHKELFALFDNVKQHWVEHPKCKI